MKRTQRVNVSLAPFRAEWVLAAALSLAGATLARAEVVHLTNGDAIHGDIVAASSESITLDTPYGELVIPKADVARIDYQGGEPPGTAAGLDAEEGSTEPGDGNDGPARNLDRWRSRLPSGTSRITLSIEGRSFWYAFDSPPGRSADTRIRLHVEVGGERACTLLDEKPDTVDGNTLYNSFTFSPTDSRVEDTLDGYACSVDTADDGEIVLSVGVPAESGAGRRIVRMVYEINEGDRSLPRWQNAVSRSFSVELSPGRETFVQLQQNADALEYSGFFKKTMKNLELFQLNLLSTELR